MAAESNNFSRSASLLLPAVAILTLYVAWQVIPLGWRVDALERARFESSDRMLARIEALENRVASLRPGDLPPVGVAGRAPAPSARAGRPGAANDSAVAGRTASTPSAEQPNVIAEEFLSRHLLPGDTALALMIVEGVPPDRLARRVQHSPAFVLGKAVQIEKQLAAVADTPPEILASMRAWIERARSAQR